MKTLSILLREGPKPAGVVAERLFLTTGAVTNVVDRLESRGLVRRVPDARDRRKVIIAVNDEKLAEGPNYYESMGEASAALHQKYTADQLQFLVEYHEAQLELVRKEIAKLNKSR